MKAICLLATLFLFLNSASAQKQEKYSRARVHLDGKQHTIRDLSALGVAVDHGEHKKGTFIITDYSASEIKAIKKAGFRVDILIKDVSKHYRDQNKKTKKAANKTTSTTNCDPGPAFDVPAHFRLGAYAGYYTYTELLSILDSMRILYPALISSRAAIDTYHTIEGRPVYWLRISNNPSVEQPAKPQILFTALHHAREPGSITSLVYFMWYMLEHYSTDTRIKALVDNSELYFVPCLNPDGYLYNIGTNPSGGGMWRKNRRRNADGSFGVDLNRNYGYMFAYDNIGSSPTTTSDTYRGTAGFSEPETKATAWLHRQHHFKIAMNYHTYGNDIIYPWGYIGSLLTPDSLEFQGMCAHITRHTPYRYGTGDQTVGYVTNGASDDWEYGDTTGGKNKIFGMTPESGIASEGFYAPATSIVPNAKNNVRTNVNAVSLLIPYAVAEHTDEKIITAASGHLHFNLQRLGFPDTATYIVTMTSLSSNLSIAATPRSFSTLTLLQRVSDSISYTIASGTPNGQLLRYDLDVYNGFYHLHDTVEFYYGKTYRNAVPNTNTLTGWTNAGWGVCSTYYHTAPASMISTTSGCGNYRDSADITIQLTAPVDLTHALHSYLYFYSMWGIESTYDYVVAQAAPTGTGMWQPLCGRYTKPGSPYQSPGDPIYDGQHQDWAQEEIDLSDYLGQRIDLRFELTSDNAVHYGGFYFDDLNVISVIDSSFVSTPELTNNAPVLRAYPNPAKDQLNIAIGNFALNQTLKAELFDNLGRAVLNCILDKAVSYIDISALPTGIYYLRTEGFPVLKVEVLR